MAYLISKCSCNKFHVHPMYILRPPVPNRQCSTVVRWLSLTAPSASLSILSRTQRDSSKCAPSSGAPRLCAHSMSTPTFRHSTFHQRGAALPACICLTDLCPLFCCFHCQFSAQKSGLPVLPLQPSWPHRNLALPCAQLSLLPAAHYTLWHCCLPILPCILCSKPPSCYVDDSIVLR